MARDGKTTGTAGHRNAGAAKGATALLATLAIAACAAPPAPPPVTEAEVDAARRGISAAPPPAAQPRTAEEGAAMLAAAAARVSAAAEPVCAAYLNRACGFSVRLDPSGAARAAAHGRGQVTISAGMVRLVETEDELAAVVAHEFGHHLAGHLNKQFARGAAAGTVAGTVIGAVVPFGGLAGWAIGQGAAQLGAGAARLAYSKTEEREADYLATYLVARAGYDLDRAGNLWARLSRPDAARDGSGVAGLLATHPAEAERLAAWRRAAAEARASPDLMPRRGG